MTRWLGQHRSPIGIDVGGRRLTAVQLARRGRGWRLASAAQFERRDPAAALDADEVRLFSEILDRQGFVGRDIVLAVPSDTLKSDLLELPAAAADVSLQQLARMELARTHKCNPEGFELAAWPLPRSARAGDGRHVMAAACTHADSEAMLEVWELGGLEPVALDIHASAVARMIRPLMAEHPHVSAALDLTWDAASLVILHRDTVIYDRTLAERGLREMHESLVKRLEVEPDVADFAMFQVGFAEELQDDRARWPLLTDARGIMATHFTSMLDELRVSFSYAQHRYPDTPVDRLYLMGRGALIPGLAEPLASMLGIEIQPVAPVDVLDDVEPGVSGERDPSLAVAVGLALFDEEMAR